MKPLIGYQRGAAAKEIILVLSFLIVVAYMAVIGLKTSIGGSAQGGQTNGAAAAMSKSDEVMMRHASNVIGLGEGFMFAAIMLSFVRAEVGNESQARVARKYVKVASLLGLLGGISAIASGFMYYSAGIPSAIYTLPTLGLVFMIPPLIYLVRE